MELPPGGAHSLGTHVAWCAILLCFGTLNFISTPIRFAMIDLSCGSHNSSLIYGLNASEFAADIFFTLELLRSVQCFTRFTRVGISDESLSDRELKLAPLATPIVESFLGALACVPFIINASIGWTFTTGTAAHCSSALSLLSLLRLFRVSLTGRLFFSIKVFVESRGFLVDSSQFRMAILMYLFCVGLAASGCAYFAIACPPSTSFCLEAWVEKTVPYEHLNWAILDTQVSQEWSAQTVRSVYFSMQTLFTIGYGDAVAPISPQEMSAACFLMFVGQFAYGAVIANMTSLMANIDVLNMRFKQEMDTLDVYMDYKELPGGLRLRVREFFNYLYQKQYGMLDEQVWNGIAPQFKLEIMQQRASMLHRVPFFFPRFRDEKFILAGAKELLPRTYTPYSVLHYADEKQSEMIILVAGVADVYAESQSISTLLPGDFIGDYNMIMNNINTASVWSKSSFVDVLVLKRDRLQRALEQYDCAEDFFSQDDPGVQATSCEHKLRDEHLSKLRATMKNSQRNKKVMVMMEEAAEYRDKFIIPPSSAFHLYWDVSKLLALLFLCIMSPLHILYRCNRRHDHEVRCSMINDLSQDWRPVFIVDYCVDIFFLIDMGLNFRCFAFNYIEDGRNVLNTSPDAIKKKYIQSRRFQLDLLGSFPLDLFLGPITGGYFSLFRLTRTTRVALLRTYVLELQRHLVESRIFTFSSGSSSLLINAFCVVITFHFISVSWALLHFRNASSSLYWESLYWAVTTFTTVGYGDIIPEDPLETTVAIMFGIGGALFAAAVIANVTASSQSINTTESNLGHQKQCFRRFFGTREIDSRVKEKVMTYYQYLENTSHGIDESKLLGDLLPWNIQDDFSLYITHKIVLNTPIFNVCKADFLKAIMHLLYRRYFVAHEWVVAEGNSTPGMFFQGRGRTQIIRPGTGLRNVLSHGGHFGAETLLSEFKLDEVRHLQWAQALTECELWFLDPVEFNKAALVYPESAQALRQKAFDELFPNQSFHAISRNANNQRRSSLYTLIHFSSTGTRDNSSTSWWITKDKVRPDDPRLGLWRAGILACIIMSIFVVTYRVAFSRDHYLGLHLILDYLIEMIILLDVIFRATMLSFVVDDELISMRRAITENYLKSTQFRVDFMSAIPLEICIIFFPMVNSSWLKRPQLFAALRFNKLLRIVAVSELSTSVERAAVIQGFRLGKNALRLTKLACIFFFASHVFGCGFFLIALVEHNHGQCNNWADEAGILTDCIQGTSKSTESFDAVDAYIQALYWAFATLTTVGYGDIHAARGSSVEAIYCTVVLFIGTFAIYSLIMSSLAEIVSQLDVSQSIFATRVEQVQRICNRRAIPDHMIARINSSLDSLWSKQCGIVGTALLAYLPMSLHAELVNDIIGHHLRKLFYVQSRLHDSGFVDYMAVAMSLEHFEPDDVLFYNGEPAENLYIIHTGAVNLLDDISKSKIVLATVNSGTISEGEFFMRQVQPCSAVVQGKSDIFGISFDAFWSVLTQRGLVDDFLGHIQHEDSAFLLKDSSTSSTIKKVSCNLKSKKIVQRKSNDDENESMPRYNYTLSPSSYWYRCWKSIALFFVVYISALTPFLIAFGGDKDVNSIVHLTPTTSAWILALDCASTFFFACDWTLHLTIFMCLHDGRLVTSPMEFRALYVHGNMAFDTLSIMPISFFAYSSKSGPLGRHYALLRLLQLSRVVRIKDYFDVFARVLGELTGFAISSPGIRRLAEWALVVIWMSHWSACAFYHVSRTSGEGTWTSQAGDICKGYMSAQETNRIACTAENHYLVALYWSLYTLTTTGYGSVPLATSSERIFAMFAMVLGGVICDSGLTSLLTLLFSEKDRKSASNKRKIECTMKYLQSINFGLLMRQRVRAHIKYVDEQLGGLLDGEVLQLLPFSREREVATHFCYQHLRNAREFEAYSPGILHHFVRYMKPYLTIPGEVLRGKGPPSELLFVHVQGHIMCINSGNQPGSRVLQPGSLIMDTWQFNHEITTSHGYANLYRMDLSKYKMAKVFLENQSVMIVNRYPERKKEKWPDNMHPLLSKSKNFDIVVREGCHEVSGELAARELKDAPTAYESDMAGSQDNSRIEAKQRGVTKGANGNTPVSALETFGLFMEDTFYRSNTRRGAEDKKEDEVPHRSLLWGHRRVKPEPVSSPSKIRYRPRY